MICPYCGKQMAQNARFCTACGREAAAPSPQALQTPAIPVYAPPALRRGGTRAAPIVAAVLGVLLLLAGVAFALTRLTPGLGKADPAQLSGFWDGACKLKDGTTVQCTLLLTLDDQGNGLAALLRDGEDITGGGMTATLAGKTLRLSGDMTGEASELSMAFGAHKDGNTLSGTGTTGNIAFTSSFVQTSRADLAEVFAEQEASGSGAPYALKWYESDGHPEPQDEADLSTAQPSPTASAKPSPKASPKPSAKASPKASPKPSAKASPKASPKKTATPKPSPKTTAAHYTDAALLEFLQGQWASAVAVDGFSFVMRIQDGMFATTMAYPKREDAKLTQLPNEKYWGMEPWNWYACSASDNVIAMDSGADKMKYWVYVLGKNSIRLTFQDRMNASWSDTDYIQLTRVGAAATMDYAAYLQGRWISSKPYDEEKGSYIGLTFPGDGTCVLSIATNSTGNPDVSKRRMDGWKFEPYRTYDLSISPDGFTVTFEGVAEKYRVRVTSFSSAHFAQVGTDEDMLYYRTLD